MKQPELREVQLSCVIDTITDAEKGRGLLGFVITFPDGRMVNQAIEYNKANYQEISAKISTLYQKAKAKYE